MPELLEAAHPGEEHRVAEVEVGRRRIEPRLHAERHARVVRLLQPRTQVLLDVGSTAARVTSWNCSSGVALLSFAFVSIA